MTMQDNPKSDLTIQLNKNNGDILRNNIVCSYFIQILYDCFFIFLIYELITDIPYLDYFNILLVIAFGVMNLYFHYELRKNKNWLKKTNETLYISTNTIIVSKKYFDKELSRINIDTQGIIKIFYQPWSINPYPPYLPDYSCGCVHIRTYIGDTSFGINLNEEEGNILIKELIPLIMQNHDPKNYIFAEIFQKEISQSEEKINQD